MKISLKNVGMLDEAEFEVGDLTIICGENNTGKTYATYSLYGFLQLNSFGGNNGHNFYDYCLEVIKNSINDFIINDFELIIQKDKFLNMLSNFQNAIFNNYKSYLPELFASNENNFNNSQFYENTFGILNKYLYTNIDNLEMLNNFFSKSNVKLKNIEKNNIIFDCNFYKNWIQDNDARSPDFRFNFIVQILKNFLYYPRPFILSTERTGASMFYKELDVNKNEVLEQINNMSGKNMDVWNLIDKRYSRYPKPVKDNIYFIRELNEISKGNSFIVNEENSLHKEIIELLFKIVGGKYIASQEGISFAPGAKKRVTKGKFPIQTASSSVRALLMLNYYILNYCSDIDILIIDEPELNLHPNNQILLGRLLVLLVNAGIKVFITTHSDYIVREISNCIMLNNLLDEQIYKIKDYTNDYKLKSDKVKAYLAENYKGKNKLSVVKISQEQGIFMETFNEAIDKQNENQGLLSNF